MGDGDELTEDDDSPWIQQISDVETEIIDVNDDRWMFRIVTELIIHQVFLRTIDWRPTDDTIGFQKVHMAWLTTDLNADVTRRVTNSREINTVNDQLVGVFLKHAFKWIDDRIIDVEQRRSPIEIVQVESDLDLSLTVQLKFLGGRREKGQMCCIVRQGRNKEKSLQFQLDVLNGMKVLADNHQSMTTAEKTLVAMIVVERVKNRVGNDREELLVDQFRLLIEEDFDRVIFVQHRGRKRTGLTSNLFIRDRLK